MWQGVNRHLHKQPAMLGVFYIVGLHALQLDMTDAYDKLMLFVCTFADWGRFAAGNVSSGYPAGHHCAANWREQRGQGRGGDQWGGGKAYRAEPAERQGRGGTEGCVWRRARSLPFVMPCRAAAQRH